ncbi:3-hydroxybutyryl-CoA dehydrogenase [bacterium]|nr:3-hydroxybutyryl-CoA dehydrogenase [bacterium]
MEIKNVIVYGAGTMGSGIVQICGVHGFNVTMVDIKQEFVDNGMAAIKKGLARLVRKEKIDQATADEILGRISPSVERAYDADIVIEAIIEDEDVKKELFADLDKNCPDHTILASNTSSIPITNIASATNRPDKVIGMHFMNPVPIMKGVEIIRGKETSDETYGIVDRMSKDLGKIPGVSNDFPGFIANRILMPYINEGAWALSEGVSDPENIDLIAKKCLNMVMGPLELGDLIGLDICLAIMNVMHDGFKNEKFAPCPKIKDLVDAGHLGRKTGKGFYDYS